MTKQLDVYTKMIMAMSILKKFDKDPGLNIVDDFIYAGPHPDQIPSPQIKRLKQLGWEPCEEYKCFMASY